VFLLLSLPVFAHQSDPVDLTVDDFVELFANAELDTGWQPKDGLLSVRFQVEADGGADVKMDGVSTLSWPENLNMELIPYEGTGFVDVLATLSVAVSLKFDIDIYSWESEIARESVGVSGGETFEPFLLEGSDNATLEFTSVGRAETVFEYYYDVITGIASVGFYASLQPQNDTVFNGIGWLVGDQLVTQFDEPIVIEAEKQPAIDTTATYLSRWTNDLDLVFVPTFQVCIAVLGCYDWDITELGLDLATEEFEHAFPSVPLYFPLPVLDLDDAQRDFGSVEVGNLSNSEIPIENLGELFLEGTATIVGSDAFTVYPDYFLANEAATDGVVITFAPSDSGVVEASLLIESNDPTEPIKEIILRGEGFIEGVNSNGDVDGSSELVKSGCGCATPGGPGAASGAALVLGLMGLALRRREDR
jgi:MYXO-CTERM domain-containing protein